jgi:MFS family permease
MSETSTSHKQTSPDSRGPADATAESGVGPRRRRLSAPTAFAAAAAVYILFMSASSAPSPLYVIYQSEWNFSATTLTTVFAVYVLGMIATLLVLGALSDHIGRRPVLAAAIALEAVSMVLFITANGVPALLIARLVQGIATGGALTTLGATLVDLNPSHAPKRAGIVNGVAPTFGLALGALGCGVLAQYAPQPTRLVYIILLVGLVLSELLVIVMPETTLRKPGVVRSLQPRLGVAERLRADLVGLIPILIASWALGGLYLSLGPSVAAGVFGLSSHVMGGLVVTLLCAPASITVFVLRGWPTERTLALAAVLLLLGTAAGLGGMEANSLPLAAAGTAIAGVGFGGSALATFGTLTRIAEPAERGELFAVAYLISYLAYSIPAVAAGIATTHVGLHETSAVYSAAVIVFCALALLAQRTRIVRVRRVAA